MKDPKKTKKVGRPKLPKDHAGDSAIQRRPEYVDSIKFALKIKKEEIMEPTAWDFRNQLMAILNAARQSGKPHIDVESGYLHTQAGEHSNSNHRMPVCCEVMRKMMRGGDSIVNEPPSGEGATLMIRYIV